jgi:L-amino acid N-acyltransferase
MKTAEIRKSTEADVPHIRAIRNDVIQKTTAIWQDNPFSEAETFKWWKDRGEEHPLYVVELDDTVVGYCGYHQFRAASGYKQTKEVMIHVAEHARGRGLGTMMLEYLVHEAKKNGIHALLALIDATNKPSIHMHQKQGFEVVGTLPQTGRKFDRWLDLCIMQKLVH